MRAFDEMKIVTRYSGLPNYWLQITWNSFWSLRLQKYGLFVNVRQNLTNRLTGLQGLLFDEIEVRQLGLPNHLLNFIWDSLWGLRFPRYDLYANV